MPYMFVLEPHPAELHSAGDPSRAHPSASSLRDQASPGVLESSPQPPPPRSPTPLFSQSPLYPAGSELTPSPATTATTTTSDSSEATLASSRCTFLNRPWLRFCEIRREHLVNPISPERLLEITREESPAPTSISRKGGLIGEHVEVVKFSFRAGGDKVFHKRLTGALIQRKRLLQNEYRPVRVLFPLSFPPLRHHRAA